MEQATILPRYELNELLTKENQLTDLLRPFVSAVKLAAGIVRNPAPDEKAPDDPKLFQQWRYTPVLGLDRSGVLCEGGSAFCQAVRRLRAGDKLCMIGDLKYAKTAYSKRQAIFYECDPAGLGDIVAPITVGGHHLANVYLGQLRVKKGDFDRVWDTYRELQTKSDNADQGVKNAEELKDLYEQLWAEDEVRPIEIITDLLARLADLISQTAAKQAILRTISDICASFGPTFDITTQGQIVLGKISKILRFTSGSILLPKGGALVTIAWIYPPEIRDPMVFDLSRPAGIAPSVFKTGKLVRFGSREEIDKCPPAFEGSREKRDLRSLLVVPLKAGKEVIGVIEVGAPEEHVYSGDDESLLETLAHYLAMRWKSNQDYAALTSVVRQSNRADLLKAIVERIPPLVHGTGCSIFLRDTSKWKPTVDGPTWNENRGPSPFDSLPARLVDSHGEFQKKVELAYEPMQGLTGWVLATGKPMRIDRGRGARTKFPLTLSPSAKWVGLPADGQMLHPKHYYEDHPFLAVPIKGSDGSVFGVIRIPDSLEDHFTDFDQNALEACASVLATVIEATNALEAVRAVNAELTHLRAAIEGVDRYLKDLAPKARREFSSRSAALIGTLSFIFGGSLLLLPGTTWHAAILPIAAAAVAWSYAWWRRPV